MPVSWTRTTRVAPGADRARAPRSSSAIPWTMNSHHGRSASEVAMAEALVVIGRQLRRCEGHARTLGPVRGSYGHDRPPPTRPTRAHGACGPHRERVPRRLHRPGRIGMLRTPSLPVTVKPDVL